MVRHSRAKARIVLEESLHPFLIACQNNHQIFALLFHHLQQHLDRFLAVVALILRPIQVVGFINEEHAAHGFLERFFGLGRSVADVLTHQIVARRHHQMPAAQIAKMMQDRTPFAWQRLSCRCRDAR